MFRVKICGITNLQDALCAQENGADAVGFIFCGSPRRIDPDTARHAGALLKPGLLRIGVFRDQPDDEIREIVRYCRLDCVQLHGAETPDWADNLGVPYIKSFGISGDAGDIDLTSWRNSRAEAFIIDNAGGGTGIPFDWSRFKDYRVLGRPLILAGGLRPENVRRAILEVRPDGVDVGSGVEAEPGRKDPLKIFAFMTAVREGYRILQEG